MKRIAISAEERNGLESVISPHFGRCPYYVLVDMEGTEVRNVAAVENPFYAQHQPGQVPHFIRSQGVHVMITGGMGGRAISSFQSYGIEPVTGAFGTVRMALEEYLGGKLSGAEACHESQEHGHEAHAAPAEGYEKDEAGRLREELDTLQQRLAQVEAQLRRLGRARQ